MADVTIGDKVYRTGKMDAKTQFHVVRRLLPLVSSITSIDREKITAETMVQAIAEAIAKLSDQEVDYVLNRALSVCSRLEGGNAWMPVWNARADRLQYEDIDLSAMMQLTVAVLQENLGGFFPDLQQTMGTEPFRPNAPLN